MWRAHDLGQWLPMYPPFPAAWQMAIRPWHHVSTSPPAIPDGGFSQSGSDLAFPLRAFPTLETGRILKPGKQADRLYARSLICHWAIRSLGMTAVAVSKLLGINRPAVTQAAYRGEAIAAADSLELVER